MNLNRSRAAAAAAIAAAVLVGMPVATAATAAAAQDPGQLLDDPPPVDGTPEGAEPDAAITLELVDAPERQQTATDLAETEIPPGQEDIERPVLVVETTVNEVADPLTDPQQALDLQRNADRAGQEESGQEREEEPGDESGDESGDEFGAEQGAPTADGPAQGEAPAGESANQVAPTGDLDNTQAGQNEGETSSTDTTAEAAAAPEAVQTTSVDASRTAVTGEAAKRSSAMALPGATIGGVLPTAPMPKTGAATVGLLQAGLGLIGLGGLLIAGTGRHRRVSETRREQGIALTV